MNLAAFLELDGGLAWVGFTASTGDSYQNHELTSWAFYEHASESSALGAAAGTFLTPEQEGLRTHCPPRYLPCFGPAGRYLNITLL